MSETNPESETLDAVAPPRIGFWARFRHLMARGLRFALRHPRLAGVSGFAVLILMVLLVSGLRTPFRPEAPLSEVETLEVNPTGLVVNMPDPGVEEYLAGMSAFDAQRMWNAFAPEVQQAQTGQGLGPTQLQERLDAARGNGARIDQVTRIGNYPLRDGRRFVFYIVVRSGFPPDGEREELYYIFTVDPSGRILDVT